MKRRNFLAGIPLAAIAAGSTGKMFERIFGSQSSTGQGDEMLIEKVKLAMLSLQRATWEQGVAMQAMLETGNSDLVILMARDAVLREAQDGRPAMLGEEFASTDAASTGEAILWAAKKTGDPNMTASYDKMLTYFLEKAPRNKEGIVYHFTNLPQVWSDSLYMLPPFLATAGKFDEAMKQIDGVRGFLWNSEKKLLSHMWDCEKNDFARKDFWGVGNGWAAAGMTRVIHAMPESMRAVRDKLMSYVRDLIDGCLAHIRTDGLFHNIIDNPGSFIETNLSQMLAYSIYRGIKGGWIDGGYESRADKMYEAARSKVDELGMVQGVCGSPEFDHPGTATEGQAFFLMMEKARADLAG